MSPRTPTKRRTAVVSLVLLFGGGVAVFILGHRLHSDTAEAVGNWVGVGAGLAGLWLTWVAYRDSADRNAVGWEAAREADGLAAAVRAQWDNEAIIRQINDPLPLPVRWEPADPSLAVDWASLERLASEGAGWPAAHPTWASAPSGLSGSRNDLPDVLERVPTARLVVLGEPGAGKTILAIRLVLACSLDDNLAALCRFFYRSDHGIQSQKI